jgi:hypothetical protein
VEQEQAFCVINFLNLNIMKKQIIKSSLTIKKATIAELNNVQIDSLKGGSTVSTSVLAVLCTTINPLDCTMSAYCAY